MKRVTILAVCAALCLAGTAQAGTIAVNFANPGTDGTSWPNGPWYTPVGTGLEPDESLGAVAQSNWNNHDVPDGDAVGPLFDWDGTTYTASDPQKYIDSTGGTTELSVSYSFGGNCAAHNHDENTLLGEMFWGVWQVGGAGDGTATIGLSNVPYTTYDVIVYIVEPVSHSGSDIVSATDGTTTYFIDATDGSAALAQSTATTEGAVSGEANYVTFSGLSGDTTITVGNNGTGWKAGVAGFQIVPEPATMALLGLGGIGLLIRSRRS